MQHTNLFPFKNQPVYFLKTYLPPSLSFSVCKAILLLGHATAPILLASFFLTSLFIDLSFWWPLFFWPLFISLTFLLFVDLTSFCWPPFFFWTSLLFLDLPSFSWPPFFSLTSDLILVTSYFLTSLFLIRSLISNLLILTICLITFIKSLLSIYVSNSSLIDN